MDPAHAIAEQAVMDNWRDEYRLGLIDASPMRPGRGRRASHPKGRRPESRHGYERFYEMLHTIEAGLRSGTIPPETARRLIHDASLEDFIQVTETREQVVEAFARLYGWGYDLWSWEETSQESESHLFRASFLTMKQLRRM